MKKFRRRNRIMEKTQKTEVYKQSKARYYKHANDKNVATYLVYADADEGHVFYESAKQNKVPAAVLKDMFIKGMTVVFSDSYYKPIEYSELSGVGTIVVHDGTSKKSFNSAEKVE